MYLVAIDGIEWFSIGGIKTGFREKIILNYLVPIVK